MVVLGTTLGKKTMNPNRTMHLKTALMKDGENLDGSNGNRERPQPFIVCVGERNEHLHESKRSINGDGDGRCRGGNHVPDGREMRKLDHGFG